MPITLATLFCSPIDIWDYLSVEGVDLREDDHNLASGQVIATTSDAVAGVTSLAVAALPVALLSGAWLTFDGGVMTVPVQVQLSAVANIGTTSISVQPTTALIPNGAQARDSGVNAATGARLVVGCRKGTSKVKLYCNAQYDDAQLKLSGTVCDWATHIAARFLCTRRAQGCPKSVQSDYEEALEEMRMVQGDQLQIEDIGKRGNDWPQVVNVTVDPTYDLMRARVQQNISEATPTNFGSYVDWNSAFFLEW